MTKVEVVGLGVSTVDLIALVDHYPRDDEVQIAADMVAQGGGPVSTAVVTLARLGARVAMLDVVGDDWRGELIKREFQNEGVDVNHLISVPGVMSSTSYIMVHKGTGNRSIVYYRGTTPDLAVADLPKPLIESARYLHVNGAHWESCLQAVSWAKAAGVRVSFDGGGHRYRPELRELVPLTDVCIVARQFAEAYTSQSYLHEAGSALLRCGPQVVGITDGVRGSWVWTRDGVSFHQPAYTVSPVVDTTGCGDTYHGAFLYGLLREWDLRQAAGAASAVAALTSRHLGGRTGIPTFAELKGFMASVQA